LEIIVFSSPGFAFFLISSTLGAILPATPNWKSVQTTSKTTGSVARQSAALSFPMFETAGYIPLHRSPAPIEYRTNQIGALE
jgi:hypothetical protein